MLLVLTISFIAYTTIQSANTPTVTNAILTLIISLFSGLVGGILAKRWDDINETGKLITKGRSAVRGLRYLSNTIATLDRRISVHIHRCSETAEKDVLTEANFQELDILCNLIQEGAISAIEEWRDIVPEVGGLFTEIGVIGELRNQKGALEVEISEMKTRLSATEEESAEGRANLEAKLANKEKELREVRSELKQRQFTLSSNNLLEIAPSYTALTLGTGSGKTLSAVGALPPSTIGTLLFSKTCVHCSHKFSYSNVDISSACPNCGMNPDSNVKMNYGR